MREIIAYHGWGFSSLFWKEWQKKFVGEWSFCERSYFSQEERKKLFFRHKDSIKIVCAHSLGLHFVSEDVLSSMDLLIVFSSFLCFHGADSQKTKAHLALMKQKLDQDPTDLLKKFYANCSAPHHLENFALVQKERLLEDLLFLDEHRLDLSGMQGKKILVFHGKEDRVVPYALGEKLASTVGGSSFFLVENAGHVFSTVAQEEIFPVIEADLSSRVKEKVCRNFSKASSSYASSACFAALSVGKFMELLSSVQHSLPEGPILEIGAGTGLLSKKILQCFPEKELIFSDLSLSMIAICQELLSYDPAKVTFCQKDGEMMEEKEKYALILSGLALQWFEDIEGTLSRWHRALKRGGYLLFSCLCSESFSEWEKICREENIPLTKNPLPDLKRLRVFLASLGGNVCVEEKRLSIPFATLRSFFRNLKETGAITSKGKTMNVQQRKKLLSVCQKKGSLTITYQIGFALVRKR